MSRWGARARGPPWGRRFGMARRVDATPGGEQPPGVKGDENDMGMTQDQEIISERGTKLRAFGAYLRRLGDYDEEEIRAASAFIGSPLGCCLPRDDRDLRELLIAVATVAGGLALRSANAGVAPPAPWDIVDGLRGKGSDPDATQA